MEDIIKIIIASFSSLWKVKKYGKKGGAVL